MEPYQQPGTPNPAEQPRRRRSRTDTPAPEMPQPPVPASANADTFGFESVRRDLPPELDDRSHRQPRVTPEQVVEESTDPLYLARAGFAPEQRTQHMPAVDPSRMYADGQPVQPVPGAPVQAVVNNANTVSVNSTGSKESFFDGKLSQQIGNGILCFLIIVLTLGICTPWAVCRMYRWRIKHTVIEGHRLTFDGKASQLFGQWILWLLLTIVTIGIYSFWVGIALEKWRVKHTHYAR